jgi:C4-dicarboxylate transporter DctQ subunit
MAHQPTPNAHKSTTDRFEETLIASLLGIMAVVTFANVVARKLFNSNIMWALELTVFLFGWMVLLGASYMVKKNAHLGVDVVINAVSQPMRRLLALVSVAVCLVFAFLLLKGAWDYWANFANLPGTEGRWFPLGFEDKFREKGWYEVNDIPHPWILGWMETVFNAGEEYEKIPRLLPYAALPLSMALLLYRFLQVAWAVWAGQQDRIVSSHEVEDELNALETAQAQKGQV